MEDTFFDESRGCRLRDERKRLKLTQAAVCEQVGVQTQAWIRYEKGQPFNLELLRGLEKTGIDMMYVIFGIRRNNSELSVENQLVKLYETVRPDQREGLLYLAKAFAAAYPVK